MSKEWIDIPDGLRLPTNLIAELRKELAALKENAGLSEIHLNHTKRLLDSCETALAGRDIKLKAKDNDNQRLRDGIQEIVETVEGWTFGWDGDCGISIEIDCMGEKLLTNKEVSDE